MPSEPANDDERRDLIAALNHALARSTSLARRLSDDPLVGSEARGLLTRLDCVQAEIDVIVSVRDRSRFALNDDLPDSPSRLWQ